MELQVFCRAQTAMLPGVTRSIQTRRSLVSRSRTLCAVIKMIGLSYSGQSLKKDCSCMMPCDPQNMFGPLFDTSLFQSILLSHHGNGPEGILLERSLNSLSKLYAGMPCVIPCHSCRNCDKVQLTAACAYGGANRRDQEWAGDPKVHDKHHQSLAMRRKT